MGIALSGCFKQECAGFDYPNRNNLAQHISIGTYKSLEDCRASSRDALNKISSLAVGDYECGLNGDTKSGMDGTKLCE